MEIFAVNPWGRERKMKYSEYGGCSGGICEKKFWSPELECERKDFTSTWSRKRLEAPPESCDQEGIDHWNREPGKEKINGIHKHFTEILRKSQKFQARKLNEN